MIAEKGHVYTFKTFDFINFKKNEGKFKPQKVGVQTASTFKGFCSIHDDFLFNCLEKESIKPTNQQCFMLLYRAYCMEFYNKKVQTINPNKLLKQILSIPDEEQFLVAKKFYDLSALPMAIAKNEFRNYYNRLQNNLKLENYASAHYYAIKIEGILPFMCAGSFGIEENIDGESLQNFMNYGKEISYISLSIFTDKENINWIIFSWLSDHDNVNQKFINSLDALSSPKKINICLNIMLKYLENFYFKISYWDNLSKNVQDDIIYKFNSNSLITKRWNIKDPIIFPINNIKISGIFKF